MKTKIIIIAISLLLISCKKTEKKVVAKKENKVIETVCTREEKRASKDIQKGKLTYYCFFGNSPSYRSNVEMKEILAQYNIGLDSTMTDCFMNRGEVRENCYETKMEEAIQKKFGKKFIDSLRTVAERRYVLNHLDKVFDIHVCDSTSIYPKAKSNKELMDVFEKDFLSTFTYPKEYKTKKGKLFSYTNASFILTKSGKIYDLKIDSSFQNPLNEKYKEYFENHFREFVMKTKWNPAKSYGMIVNSKVIVSFYHK